MVENRRTFLRGLASLPLIGGAVTLIGNPSRAAVCATTEQMDQYMAFLFMELNDAMRVSNVHQRRLCLDEAVVLYQSGLPDRSAVAFRAPVILSAAGVPLA